MLRIRSTISARAWLAPQASTPLRFLSTSVTSFGPNPPTPPANPNAAKQAKEAATGQAPGSANAKTASEPKDTEANESFKNQQSGKMEGKYGPGTVEEAPDAPKDGQPGKK